MRKKDRKKKKDRNREIKRREKLVSKEDYNCQECDEELEYDCDYHWRYRLCNRQCGLKLCGLHINDFY